MKIERTKNASRNIIWGFIEKIACLLLPFITRTVLIRVLGAEYLGLSSLFTSILSVLSISELGVGSAIVFSMYEPIAKDDDETLCALLNVYRKIYGIIGIIILVCGLLLAPFVPNLISGSIPKDINIYVLYFIYLANTVSSYFMYAYKASLFSAYQRNDLMSKRTTLINVCSNIIQIVALFFFKNYYAYVVIIPLATIVTNIANAYLAKKVFPRIECRGTISSEMKESIKKRVFGLLSFKVNNVVFSSVDTIVISAFLGLTTLAIYNNYYYIQTTIIGFLTIFTNSMTAGIGNKMILESRESNYKDFKNIVFINGWMTSWCAICLLCLYQHFIGWWIGEQFLFSIDTMILIVFFFFLPRISTITYTYREAAGLWWEDRFRPIISSIINLTTNLILVRIIGMNGVIISSLICTIFIAIPWGSYVLFKNYFKTSPMEYFRMLLFYIVVTLIIGAITYSLCSLLPTEGLISMIVKAIICIIIPNLLFCLFYHKQNEFQFLKRWVVRIVNRVTGF